MMDFLEENGEKVKLVGYFVVMTVIAAPLFQALGTAWKTSALLKPIVYWFTSVTPIGFKQLVVVLFGGFLGILVLLTLDPKKRWQGILLWIGTAVAMVVLGSMGLFIPNLNLLSNLQWLGFGIVLGGLAGGGRQLTEVRTAEAREFRRAATLLFYIVSLIVVLGLLEYHLQFPQLIKTQNSQLLIKQTGTSMQIKSGGLLRNVAFAGLFIFTMRKFVEYDAEKTFLVLGPPSSGKSLFLVGMYLAALNDAEGNHSETPLNPSGDLMDLVGTIDAATQDDGWNIASTGATETKKLSFRYISGRTFPKNIELTSLDYAGEYLNRLPDALTAPGSEIDSSTLRELAERVQESDTLILLIDLERYENNEKLGIEPYFDILNAASGKEIVLVATKADILAEEFREQEALEAHRYPEEFEQYVNDTLKENSQEVRPLVQDISNGRIRPVYYQTTVDDNGERVPSRNSNGGVMTNGFERLLRIIG